MAGHSKWKTIKHRKGAEDGKRALIYARIGYLRWQTLTKLSFWADGTNPSTSSSSLLLSSLDLSDTQSLCAEYEPASEPLHISVK